MNQCLGTVWNGTTTVVTNCQVWMTNQVLSPINQRIQAVKNYTFQKVSDSSQWVKQTSEQTWAGKIRPVFERREYKPVKQKTQYVYARDIGTAAAGTTVTTASTAAAVFVAGPALAAFVIMGGAIATLGVLYKVHANVQQRKNDKIWNKVNDIRQETILKTTDPRRRGRTLDMIRQDIEKFMRQISGKNHFSHVKERDNLQEAYKKFNESTTEFFKIEERDYQSKKHSICQLIVNLSAAIQNPQTQQVLNQLQTAVLALSSKENQHDFTAIKGYMAQLNPALTQLNASYKSLWKDIDQLEKLITKVAQEHKTKKRSAILAQEAFMRALCPERPILQVNKLPKPPLPVFQPQNPLPIQPIQQPIQQIQQPVQPINPLHQSGTVFQPNQNTQNDGIEIVVRQVPENPNPEELDEEKGVEIQIKETPSTPNLNHSDELNHSGIEIQVKQQD